MLPDQSQLPTKNVNITYACPACHEGVRCQFDADTPELECPHCHGKIALADDAVQDNRVHRCLVCPSTDLYIRKDFPQRLGAALVGVGILGSTIAWNYSDLLWTFGILFATALIDVVLYMLVGDALMCYRCFAQYRGVAEMDSHGQFDLETHEKHRQMVARMEEAQK